MSLPSGHEASTSAPKSEKKPVSPSDSSKGSKEGQVIEGVSPHEQRYLEKRRDPASYLRKEQTTTPEVSDETKGTLAKAVVDQFMAMKAVGFDKLQNDYDKQFFSILKHKYEEVNHSPIEQATEDQLNAAATMLMDKEIYQLWATKVIEDQLIAIEASTGAKHKGKLPTDKPFFARTTSISADGFSEGSRNPFLEAWERMLATGEGMTANHELRGKVEFSNELFTTTVQNGGVGLSEVQVQFLRRFIGQTDMTALTVSNKGKIEQQMNSVAAARMNFYRRQGFVLNSEADFNLATRTAGAGFNLNRSNNPNFTLDRFDIKPVGGVSLEVGVGTGIAGDLQAQLRVINGALLQEVTEFEKAEATKSRTEIIQARIATLRAKLDVPQTQADRDQIANIDREIVELRGKLKDAQDYPQSELRLKEIANELADLESKLPPEVVTALEQEKLDQDELTRLQGEKRIKEEAKRLLDEEKDTLFVDKDTEEKTKQSLEKTKLEQERAIQGLTQERDTLMAQIQTTTVSIQEIAKQAQKTLDLITGVLANGGDATVYQAASADLRTQQGSLEAQLKVLNDKLAFSVLTQLASQRSGLVTTETNIQGQDVKIRNIERQIRLKKDAAASQISEAQREIEAQEKKIQKSKDKISGADQELINKRKARLDEKKKLEASRKAIEARSPKVKVKSKNQPEVPKSGDIEQQIKDKEAEKKKYEKKKDPLVARQLEAYEELLAIDSHALHDIEGRAMLPGDSIGSLADLKQARETYPSYPPVYLRLLHVMYGPDITLPQNWDKMKRAATLLTLEKMMDAVPGLTAANLQDLAAVTLVNLKVIDDLFNKFNQEVNAGTLGVYKPDELIMIDKVKGISEKAEDFRKRMYDSVTDARRTRLVDLYFDPAKGLSTTIESFGIVVGSVNVDTAKAQDILTKLKTDKKFTKDEINTVIEAEVAGIAPADRDRITQEILNRLAPLALETEMEEANGYGLDQVNSVAIAALTGAVGREVAHDFANQLRSGVDIDAATTAVLASRTTLTPLQIDNVNEIRRQVNIVRTGGRGSDQLLVALNGSLNLPPYSALKPVDVRTAELNLAKSVVEKHAYQRLINTLSMAVLPYGSLDELALQIAKLQKYTDTQLDRAKALASEVDKIYKKRVELKKVEAEKKEEKPVAPTVSTSKP